MLLLGRELLLSRSFATIAAVVTCMHATAAFACLLATAAAAGEALKDKCHEDNIIAAGGLFCPLIKETVRVCY